MADSNSNLFVSLAATIFFSYVILRLNKENEINILQEKKFGDTIFNTSLDGVFIIFNESNTIANCNRRALELFEADESDQIEGSAQVSLSTPVTSPVSSNATDFGSCP